MYVAKVPVANTGRIRWLQNMEMLICLGENALGCH